MSAVIELADHRAPTPVRVDDLSELPEWVRELVAELPPVMSPRTLSEATEISVPTLARWRKTWPKGECVGPPFSAPAEANMVRYFCRDLVSWLLKTYSAGAGS
ncbi:hypothetical protein Leucomu_03480 [Leucobacter muris]|uniref:DNA-binding protein n=1 Tax=Leucobacter muris TaxID=1935379 RepID=A0ABX5QDK5_9MICO|nr:hypothetical protein [Leucobacter muris]QAB17103.1 hypothetical protein Leucomu_03480 [Leucobacter muris]